jgi:hypothetical protein
MENMEMMDDGASLALFPLQSFASIDSMPIPA